MLGWDAQGRVDRLRSRYINISTINVGRLVCGFVAPPLLKCLLLLLQQLGWCPLAASVIIAAAVGVASVTVVLFLRCC
jgi:hypothetical protein